MLICTADIDPVKFIKYREDLREALTNPAIQQSISPHATMDAFDTTWESPMFPKTATVTFFSIHNDEILGVCQYQKISYIEGFIHCNEVLTYNFSKNNVIYGRDCRKFYDLLNESVHKGNLSIMGNFDDTHFDHFIKHLSPYGGRYVGKFEKHTTNALGEIVDVHMVEFITKKGKEEYFNNSRKSC